MVFGSLLALVIYLFWLIARWGIFREKALRRLSPQAARWFAGQIVPRHQTARDYRVCLLVFSNLAVASSFFGVTLGCSIIWRICLRLITPTPGVSNRAVNLPATCVVVSDLPERLFYGIGGAGLCATIWAVIIPACWQSKLARSFPIRCSRSGAASYSGDCHSLWYNRNFMLVRYVFNVLPKFG